MTVRLTVNRTRWWNHVTYVAETVRGLVPVVKGNGYGLGRDTLATAAAKLSPIIAVGTVHELADLPDETIPVVLTPTLTAPESTEPVLTVGSEAHIAALHGCCTHGSGIGARILFGETEASDYLPSSHSWQPLLFLFL